MRNLLIIAAIALSVFAYGCKKEKKAPAEIIVTDVAKLDIQGFEQLKKDNVGNILLVNVFATWCPPCEEETPGFVSVYNSYKDKGFNIIGLSIDDNKQDLIDFINQFGIRYPVYMIGDDVQRKLYADKVPTNIIYRRSGILYNAAPGMISESDLKAIIKNME